MARVEWKTTKEREERQAARLNELLDDKPDTKVNVQNLSKLESMKGGILMLPPIKNLDEYALELEARKKAAIEAEESASAETITL